MTEDTNAKGGDLWRFPALGLWQLLFFAGLAPEPVFYFLRAIGGVASQRALVNSPYVITLGLAAWMVVFSFYACVRAGLTAFQAQDRALQLGVIALIAFLPIDPVTLIEAHSNPLMRARIAMYIAAGGKLVAWLYLLGLLIRYYALQMDDVFARIPSVFPSAYRTHGADKAGEDPGGNAAKPEPEQDAPGSVDSEQRKT